ncbi:MAG: hypothetical protein JW953_03445 [Anaerolineae bacterium]|nr:hypothetical protein [Anaerolineae bacterium]
MNKPSFEQSVEPLAAHLQKVAPHFPYPATPNIVAGVKQHLAAPKLQAVQSSRRLAWTMLVAGLAVVALLALPPVRAAIFDVLRQGVVRIFLLEPLATSTPLVTITPAASAESPAWVSPQSFLATPRPSATPISSIQVLMGVDTPAAPPVQPTLTGRPSPLPPAMGNKGGQIGP